MNIVRAEWTKLRTTPAPAWLLLATVTGTVALGAAVCSPGGCVDATRLALSGVYLGQAPVAVLGVLSISGEYSTRLIHVTLTAIPNRPAVLAAKALVLAVVVAAAGSLAVLGSLLVAGVGLRDGWVGAGTVAYLALVAVLSLGTAALVRDSAAAIGTVLGLLFLPPVLTQLVTDEHLRRLLDGAAPGPSARIGVVAAWSAGALLAGTLRLRFRDT
ncbi:ABC transporter permease subunit [Virgisporangium aurantiacum]